MLGPAVMGDLPPDDPYVRRYWSAVIGPTAVAELLRLIEAARRGVEIPRPWRLTRLLAVGLVRLTERGLTVAPRVPPVPDALAVRLPPALRAEHRHALTRRARPDDPCAT